MELSKTQLSAMSRLFSSGVIRELASRGRSSLFTELFLQTGIMSERPMSGETVGSAYKNVFSILKKSGSRDEYVYRSAIAHNILLGRHSLKTACMLTEFRAGSCKADVVILNGTSTAYEIKSDRDSLTRLDNQINNYRNVFAKIYVIAGKSHIQEVMDRTTSDVGVLDLTNRNQIRTVREATERPDLVCPVTIFNSLRVHEAKIILGNLGKSVPEIPNTLLRSEMEKMFRGLPPESTHNEMVSVLKKTRSLAALSPIVEKIPSTLRAAALSIPMHNTDQLRLIKAVNTPLNEAMDWN